jgi:superfamily II DNA or RNA helicase
MNLTIAHSAVNAKIVDATKEVKAVVQELLAYAIEGALQSANDKWAGRNSLFEWAEAKFPTGFVPIVMAKLTQLGYRVNIVKKPLPAPLGPARPLVDAFGYDDARYNYQPELVDKVVRFGQVIGQVATGGGKSRIARMLYKRIGRPTLFLTTRGVLFHQMAKEIVKLDGKCGMLGDDQWSPLAGGFNVGMTQTFAAKLRLPNPTAPAEEIAARYAEIERVTEILKHFEVVIGEEAHEAAGNSYYDIMRLCTNAHYRLALTATPFMKGEEANMRLQASFGPIAQRVTEKYLIDCGILARPIFKFVRFDDTAPEGFYKRKDTKGKVIGLQSTKLARMMPWPKCYEVGIVHGVKRNSIIVYEAMRAAQYGLRTLILVQAQDHGKKLQSMITDAGVRTLFIFGEHSQKERDAALAAVGDGRLPVLIGSNILDVGVDVPSLDLIIIASGGKAEVNLRQRVGRGMRAKKNGPNQVFIIEFDDWQNNYLRDHSKARRAIIESTPGFVEGILPAHADFDFTPFAERKVA